MSYDVIVIGSGFGGAITGCRLAEAGLKVLILERGRRWDKTNYPREPEDKWIWDHYNPEKENGWLDLRLFGSMSVAQGAAVGGGSLIYASISVEAPKQVFDNGWPKEVTYSELQPYYETVKKFMNVQKMPESQANPRSRLMKEGAEKLGYGDRFKFIDMAVSFDRDREIDPLNPPKIGEEKRFINDQGVEQGTCIHLGNCDIGCDVYAKNTLDKNYIPWAEKHGAEVRPFHLVTNIEPTSGGGYRVSFDRIDPDAAKRIPGSEDGTRVIVAAGCLGSNELLLRCRDITKSLPDVSPMLGHHWSSNGDFLTPAFYPEGVDVAPTRGPTISSAIDFLDGAINGQSFWVEDGGIPNLLADMARRDSRFATGPGAIALVKHIWNILLSSNPASGLMPWFSQGRDAGNGVFSLKRHLLLGRPELHLDWDITASRPLFDTTLDTHEKLSAATGGKPFVLPTWTISHDLITPHPLGGCGMGDTRDTGVVDHRGAVFGYEGLYVADAAIIPTPLGVNPSRTIGALAERIAKIIIDQG